MKRIAEQLGFDSSWPAFMRRALALALPIAAQRVVSLLVNLLDNLMVGSLGDTAISACSLGNQFFTLYLCVITGLIGGAVIIATQAWGNRDAAAVKRMTSAGIWLCFLAGLLFSMLTLRFPENIIKIYTDQSPLFAPGASYLGILAWSFLPYALTTAVTMMLQAVGSVRIGFYIECVNSALNALLNWILIFGKLGAPALGLEGAAIATVIARYAGLVIAILYLFRLEKSLGFRFRDLLSLPDRTEWLVYARCGLPILIGDTLIMLNSMVQTMITGRISDVYIAANSIVHVIWQIAILTGSGFERASAIMVGGDIGAGDMDLAQRDGERFLGLSLLQGLVSAVVVLAIGPVLLSFYNVSAETAAVARTMIGSASVVVFTMAVQYIVTKGVIRSGGKTRQVMVVDLLSCACFGLPLGYLAAFVLRWPPYAIYIVIRSDYLVKAIWGVVQLKRKKWILRLVG